MPIVAFCEECGAKKIIYQKDLGSESIQIKCPGCGDIYSLREEDIEVLTGDVGVTKSE